MKSTKPHLNGDEAVDEDSRFEGCEGHICY